jgi:hypothetical protein
MSKNGEEGKVREIFTIEVGRGWKERNLAV